MRRGIVIFATSFVFGCQNKRAPRISAPGWIDAQKALVMKETYDGDHKLTERQTYTYADVPIAVEDYRYRVPLKITTRSFSGGGQDKIKSVIDYTYDQDWQNTKYEYLSYDDAGNQNYRQINEYEYKNGHNKPSKEKTQTYDSAILSTTEVCERPHKLSKTCTREYYNSKQEIDTKRRSEETETYNDDGIFLSSESKDSTGKLDSRTTFDPSTLTEVHKIFSNSGARTITRTYSDKLRSFILYLDDQSSTYAIRSKKCEMIEPDIYSCTSRTTNTNSKEDLEEIVEKVRICKNDTHVLESRAQSKTSGKIDRVITAKTTTDKFCNKTEFQRTYELGKPANVTSENDAESRVVYKYDEHSNKLIKVETFDMSGRLQKYTVYVYE